MGTFNLDKETIMQPNAKLKNLFGGIIEKKEVAIGEQSEDYENGSNLDISQSSDQD